MKSYDPDILKAELVILKAKEEELILELEETRANIGMYQNEIDIKEDGNDS